MTHFLLQQAVDGQPLAIESLVHSLRPRIDSMAAHYARRCGEDVDDLRQEAWLGLLEVLPKLNLSIGDPEQYLIRHARWRLLDAVRHARLRRCDSLDSGPQSTLEGVSEISAHEALSLCAPEWELASLCCREFCDELQSTQRLIIACLLRGLTWREAAQVVGCTSANIAYHVRQIRRHYQSWNNDEFLPASLASEARRATQKTGRRRVQSSQGGG